MRHGDSIMTPYTFDVSRLRGGHSYGNSLVYCALDAKSDLFEAQNPRAGLRDSMTQAYYLHGWTLAVLTQSGSVFEPTRTTFAPLYQETELSLPDGKVFKRFFVPYENNHLRSAHYVLKFEGASRPGTVRCRIVLPAGASASRAEHLSTDARATELRHAYLAITYPDGFVGALWGSGPLLSMSDPKGVAEDRSERTAEFTWDKEIGDTFAVSFASSPHGNAVAAVIETWEPDAGQPPSHLRRVATLEQHSQRAIDRHLNTARLFTPDRLVNRGVNWAKVNQLKDYQEYRHGAGFSNQPPSDVLVARDTFWFLLSTNYYAQAWSRRILETWFHHGLEPNGKFIEYMLASSNPLFKDDYGLNINDNTPLMLIASHHYYALTGDRGFLDSAYPSLLASANYILDQRRVGANNRHGLVWCTSTEHFVRGLATWRNCFQGGQISGAVTEINSECYRALMALAELALAAGDDPNAQRLTAAAEDLRGSINDHLRSRTQNNPFYLLMINPAGEPVDQVTGDLLFPALCGVADRATSRAIVEELFGTEFWVESPSGAGGIRTVRPDQPGATQRAEPGNYGLTGGVWPNLALWAARAASDARRPDLVLKALRGTLLLADREDFERYNVTPGEFPEYFNGDDLVQRGNSRSTFIHGSYIWAAIEGLMGITPHADGIDVNPVLPDGWGWIALSNVPYRGYPLSILAVAETRTLYTTTRVNSDWKQVMVALAKQEEFELRADGPVFWMVVLGAQAEEILAASDDAAAGRLIHRQTGRPVAEFEIPAKGLIRRPLPVG